MSDNYNVNARLTSVHKDVLSQFGITVNSNGTISNGTVTALTNGSQQTQVVDSNGNVLFPSGTPYLDSIEITRPADTTAYTALDNIATYPAAVKQKETLTFTGTSGTATVTTGSLVHTITFDTDIQQTVINFESLIVLDYAAAGITVTRNLEDIIFEASVAGVPFTAPVIANATGDLTGTVAHTTANVTLVPYEFELMSINNGGGGFLMDVKIETNITAFASKNFRVWLYREQPTTLLGDNVAFVNSYSDKNKLIGFIDVTMEALLTGSDSVVGQASSVMKQYTCADTSLFIALQTIDAVTPTSGGKFNITLNVLKLN